MDFLEKAFEKIWKTKQQQIRERPSTIFLKDIKKIVLFHLNYLLPTWNDSNVFGSLDSVGFYNKDLYLPEMIGFFEVSQKNYWAYISLALKSCACVRLGLSQEKFSASKIERRVKTLEHLMALNQFLENEFKNYAEFEKENQYFFQKNYSKIQNLKFKSNDIVPDFLSYFIPELPFYQTTSAFLSQKKLNSFENKKINQKNKNLNEVVKNLSKEEKEQQVNPVMHSFEKMQTLDGYDGRRRVEDGEDELEDHLKALEEVSLNKVTVTDSEVKSIFRAEIEGSSLVEQYDILQEKEERKTFLESVFLYEEWDYKKQQYLKEHCKVLEKRYFFDLTQGAEEKNFFQNLRNKYRFNLFLWQQKIESIVNEPLWIKKQLEGTELDLDSCLDLEVSRKRKENRDFKIYAKKDKKNSDVAICFLFDQSMSTDSYVANECILSLIKESLGLISEIFFKSQIKCHIAGTYSQTRHKILYSIYKDFETPWNEFNYNISKIKAEGYTRLGPAIRHATYRLEKQKNRKKVLILFTDGRPTDLDHYEGKYGINDVSQAFKEAEKKSLETFVIAIDQQQRAHFSKMFRNWKILSNPHFFPDQLIAMLTKFLKV